VVYAGSGDNNLYALDATTGAYLAKYTAGGQITSSPVIVNGAVYFGAGDGYLYALHLPGH
jgi:outer membrane protein assembly factor BamB